MEQKARILVEKFKGQTKIGIITYDYNPRKLEAESGGILRSGNQPRLYRMHHDHTYLHSKTMDFPKI